VPAGSSDAPSASSLRELVFESARIGCLGFGGPAAQIAMMHERFVVARKWVTARDFEDSLGFCTLLPGPEAQQLATSIGWRLHGTRGGLVAGGLFVLPGALVMLALSAAYVAGRDSALVSTMFAAIGCCVLALVIQAMIKLGRRALGGALRLCLALLAALALVTSAMPVLALIGLGAAAGAIWLSDRDRPVSPAPALPWRTIGLWSVIWLAPVGLVAGVFGIDSLLAQVGVLFSILSTVTFGGAYATLAFLQEQAVEVRGWLEAAEMVDGLGLAETTPGPLVLVNQFVAFLAGHGAGGPGLAVAAALLATWCTFAPSFLWIFAGARHADWLRGHGRVRGVLAGVLATVLGLMAAQALIFAFALMFGDSGRVTLLGPISLPVVDPARMQPVAVGLTLAAIAAVFGLRAGALTVVLAACAVGAALGLAGVTIRP